MQEKWGRLSDDWVDIEEIVVYGFGSAAEVVFDKISLKIQKKDLSLEDPNIAISNIKLGTLYYLQGNFTNALEYFNKAVMIFKKVLGKDHEQTKALIQIINNIENKMQQ